MLARKYESAKMLSGHTSSITALRFSPNGDYLASGCESGVILVTTTDSWETVQKVVNISPVTALQWDSTFPMTLVCGFASGAMVTIHIGDGDLVRRLS
jgi:WD40 repeat protein